MTFSVRKAMWLGARMIVPIGILAACKGDSITSRDPDAVFGDALVHIQTFGVNVDADGYRLDVRGLEQHNAPVSGQLGLRLLVGPARLTLSGVADNCYVAGDPEQMVTIDPVTEAVAHFVVTCGGGKQHLAFASIRNGQADIYVMEDGSTTETQITNSLWRDSDPVWSPSGDRIAHATHSPDSATTYIRILSATGDSLGSIGSPGTHAEYPTWAVSSDRIAFAWNVSGNFELYTANLDGSGLVRLTDTPDDELRPAWSPDGTELLYDVDVPDLTVERDLFIMNADGSGARQVATGGKYNYHGAWSPDGRSIAFVSHRDGNEEVYTLDLGDGTLTRLTNSSVHDGSPTWSVDGKSIIFESRRAGGVNLFRRAVHGTETFQVTDNLFDDVDPALSR
jgi:TolB protein